MPRTFKLSRSTAHRRALFRNQVTSLFKHERIQTTFAKAQALRAIAETMITLGKRGTAKAYTKACSFIQEPAMVRKCFTELAERYKFRPGGYTRVLRTKRRRHDNAEMAYIELIDREGELRSPRGVGYEYAVRKGLVPAPLSPIETPADLVIASAISPSTSNDVTIKRKHFLRVVPDHVKYYPKFTRSTRHIPHFARGLTKIIREKRQASVQANETGPQ